MTHLDSESWSRLQRKDPEATAYFAQHLAAPCETCEAFLAVTDGGALEAAADDLLLPRSDAPLDEVGFARVRRGLRSSRSLRWGGALAGALAAALVVTVVLREPKGEAWDGIKGEARLGLSLSAAASTATGWERIQPGAQLGRTQSVVLRYEVAAPAQAVLVEDRGPGTPPRPLGTFSLLPGAHDLSAAVELEEERGAYRLWLVARAGERPLSADEAVQAVRSGGGERLELQSFPLKVEDR